MVRARPPWPITKRIAHVRRLRQNRVRRRLSGRGTRGVGPRRRRAHAPDRSELRGGRPRHGRPRAQQGILHRRRKRSTGYALQKSWSKYSGTDKQQCLGMEKTGGPSSYVELAVLSRDQARRARHPQCRSARERPAARSARAATADERDAISQASPLTGARAAPKG